MVKDLSLDSNDLQTPNCVPIQCPVWLRNVACSLTFKLTTFETDLKKKRDCSSFQMYLKNQKPNFVPIDTRVELTLKFINKNVKNKAIAMDEVSMFIATLANFVDGLSLISLFFSNATAMKMLSK